jgi:hypothetical protein
MQSIAGRSITRRDPDTSTRRALRRRNRGRRKSTTRGRKGVMMMERMESGRILRTIIMLFITHLQLSRMCSRSYTMPLFSVCNIAADYALGGQKKG